jgi:hypothetical protein
MIKIRPFTTLGVNVLVNPEISGAVCMEDVEPTFDANVVCELGM